MTSPIYYPTGLDSQDRICAAFTGRGTSHEHNRNFSFHWPPPPPPPPPTASQPAGEEEDIKSLSQLQADSPPKPQHPFTQNLQYIATQLGFNPRSVTWPNGGWPHSGQVVIAEDLKWVPNPQTGGVMPVTVADDGSTRPANYDGIVTRSPDFVLAVQGADCPSIFLHAPDSGVIGVVHAGWKPLVRGVVGNAINAMVACGARRDEIVAYIGPGAGDRYTEFRWDDDMETHVRDVFVQAGRENLLESSAVRHELTIDDRRELGLALQKDVRPGFSFKISSLAVCELERNGVMPQKITRHEGSTIVDIYPATDAEAAGAFRYHSYRRDRPNHGLSLGILFLKSTSGKEPANDEG